MDALQLAHRVALGGLALGLLLPLIAGPVSGVVKLWNDKRDQASAMPMGDALKGGIELDVGTWSISTERDEYIARRARGYLAAAGAGILLFAGGFLLAAYQGEAMHIEVREWRWLGIGEIGAGVVIGAYSLMPYIAARNAYRSRHAATAAALVAKALDNACSAKPPLSLPDLFRLNRRQLDEYQKMTQRQQRSAFVWAQIATIASFVLLGAAIILALSRVSNVEKYVAGGLSALGTLLSAFVAKTFIATAKDANVQMNLYYLEPQRTGRLLAAQRIIAQLAKTTDPTLVSKVVAAVLSWEMPEDRGPTSKGASSANSDGAAANADEAAHDQDRRTPPDEPLAAPEPSRAETEAALSPEQRPGETRPLPSTTPDGER
jgi:hypothetical protein